MPEQKSSPYSSLPNTQIKVMLEKNLETLKFRHEKVWEIYSLFNKVSWDNLLTYELALDKNNAYFNNYIHNEWKALCERDYPLGNDQNYPANVNFRDYYLSQPNAIDKASLLGQQDLRIFATFVAYQPENQRWQYYTDTLKKEINKNVLRLRDASDFIKKNKKMMLAAVKQDGWALRFAHETLKKDPKIVLAAVKQHGGALEYAHEDLKKDRAIVLEAVKQRGRALEYAHEDLKKDRAIVLEAIKQHGWALEYAHEELKKDRKIVLEAVKQHGGGLQFADEGLRIDFEFLLSCYYINSLCAYNIPGILIKTIQSQARMNFLYSALILTPLLIISYPIILILSGIKLLISLINPVNNSQKNNATAIFIDNSYSARTVRFFVPNNLIENTKYYAIHP